MKKNIAIAALAAALLLTGCSNGNSSASEQSSSSASESASTAEAELKTAAEKADAVLANITFSGEMVAVDTDTIDVRFGFSADGISDYAAYICGSGAYPDEFGVFTADSAEKADEIKTATEGEKNVPDSVITGWYKSVYEPTFTAKPAETGK